MNKLYPCKSTLVLDERTLRHAGEQARYIKVGVTDLLAKLKDEADLFSRDLALNTPLSLHLADLNMPMRMHVDFFQKHYFGDIK